VTSPQQIDKLEAQKAQEFIKEKLTMETPYYFEIINQERRDDISKEVNASRPYFQNNHERTHKSGGGKRNFCQHLIFLNT
jgi:cation transport regulator ChaB